MAEKVEITSKAMQHHSSLSLRGRSTYFAFLLMMNPSPHQVPYESLMVQPYPGPVIAPNWKATIDQQVSIFSRSNLIFLPSSGSKRSQPSGIGTWKPSTTTTPNWVLDLLHCLSSWGNSLISCISVYKLTRLIYPPECPRPPFRAHQPALLLNIIVTQMNRQQQVEAYEEIQEYLQHNDVYALLGQLVQQVVLEKPKNLLDFLIQKLEAPERFTLFVVGPPGLSINAIIKKALTNVDKQFELFNCGDEITKIHESFREEDKTRFNSCLLVEEASIAGIISKIEALSKTDQNYIIQGFPKNIKQAHLLQKNGIYAKNLLIINIDDAGLREIIGNKIQLLHPDAKTEERNRLVALATMEHKINMEQIKKFYTKYLEIDLSANRQEAFIIRQLNKAFSIKTISSVPRVSSQIIIMGAPFSGRTALGKKIAEHYNFVYISTSFLLAEEIRRDTIHGRKIKSQFINNQLIDNFLIEKLIQERTAKKDCKMQGFVLEGYPKNREQFENIKNMKLSPTLIVAIDAPLELVKPRGPSDPAKLQSRMQKWQSFAAYLRESKEKIFWVNPELNIGSLYEEVVHEFEKLFT